METSAFGEKYNAQHHKLPRMSYHCRVPMFHSAVAQLVPNYGAFPAGSEFNFRLFTYDSWQKLQSFE